MRVVGVRELKDKLSEYLREVHRGETVLVTDRGRAVARLAPVDEQDAALPEEERILQGLAAHGIVRRATRPHDPRTYRLKRPLGDRIVSGRLLDEERGER